MRTRPTKSSFILLSVLILTCSIQGCSKQFFGFGDREEVVVAEIGFDYLSTRTKFKYKNGNDKTKATARMRIKKDSLIWFSLTPGVGVEAARGIISKDSLILMDRINKEAYYFSFDSLSKKFDSDFSYDLFQSVLIGDLPFAQSRGDEVEENVNDILITQERNDLTIVNKIDMKLGRLKNLYASTKQNDNTLEIKYNEFKPLNEKAFANKALMILTYFIDGKKEQATVDLEHNRIKIEEEPLRFPFSVPSRYKRN